MSARDSDRSAEGYLDVRRLPAADLVEAWRRILVPEGVKARLVQYLDLLRWLSERRASRVALALQRAILLFGPPGCGKTTLAASAPNEWARGSGAKALLAVVNAHSLPSGERGGSQRNIALLFVRLEEVAACGEPVFVVIDELETIGTERTRVDPTTNPLDSLYSVNAFIESLDAINRRCPNIVLLYTTNLPQLVDRALADRVDFAMHIPLPDEAFRRLILEDALREVESVGVQVETGNGNGRLDDVVPITEGFSARRLRHLVVSALSLSDNPASLTWAALTRAAKMQGGDLESLEGGVEHV